MPAVNRHRVGPVRTALFLGLLTVAIKWAVCLQCSYSEDLVRVAPWGFGYEEGHIAANVIAGNGFSITSAAGNLPAAWGSTLPTTSSANFLPSAWVSPLYPLLLSEIFRYCGIFTPAAASVVIAVNCLAQGVTVSLLYLLGFHLGQKRVGFAAVGLFLVDPNAWQFLGWVWHTQLYAMLLLCHIYVLMRPARSPVWQGCLLGITLALALLTDGAAVMLVPITAFYVIRKKTGNNRILIGGAALLSGALLMTPWAWRNYEAFGAFNPLRGSVSTNLWVGNHAGNRDESYHGLSQSPWHNQEEFQTFVSLGEKGYSQLCRERVIAQVRSHPGRFLVDSLKRTTGFWFGEWWNGYSHIHWIYSAGLGIFTLLAIAGVYRGRKLHIELLLAVFLLFPLPYYLTVHGHGRYRAPIEPLICLAAALVFYRAEKSPSKSPQK
ncbi:hypothetical protein Pan258_40590 [Symmachiella dynata]|uniref:hypothetical protein n=1 Tax=Symmachiella dynata TaxID=2527995 RepID=UPI00118B041C|nr:hypothetical protein [Symmachiella dynata]QDT50003.1 hypothetical protein Pan258_40590 [Symmachiella dynata]